MQTSTRTIVSILGLAISLSLGGVLDCRANGKSFRSPDKKYEAKTVRAKSELHYQVTNLKNEKVVLVTNAKYRSPNDVKAGRFSPDSTQFAAAYHYGHGDKGEHTWVGVWNLKDGEFVQGVEMDGYLLDIPASVFRKVEQAEEVAETELYKASDARLLLPKAADRVARVEDVKGWINLKSGGWPVVIVRPLVDEEPWFVQPEVEGVTKKGLFTTRAYFGDAMTPAGTEFRILILVAPSKKDAEEKYPRGTTFRSLPADLSTSDPVEVIRR